MELTGKAKEDFEQFFKNNIKYWSIIKEPLFISMRKFYNFHDSMKYGVYVDFFDSVNLEVLVKKLSQNKFASFVASNVNTWAADEYSTRHEARTKAIEKANETYNNQN